MREWPFVNFLFLCVLATSNVVLLAIGFVMRRRYGLRIAALELEVLELKARPCPAPCAALLQREQFAVDMQNTMRSLARRIESLEEALGRTLDAGMPKE